MPCVLCCFIAITELLSYGDEQTQGRPQEQLVELGSVLLEMDWRQRGREKALKLEEVKRWREEKKEKGYYTP